MQSGKPAAPAVAAPAVQAAKKRMAKLGKQHESIGTHAARLSRRFAASAADCTVYAREVSACLAQLARVAVWELGQYSGARHKVLEALAEEEKVCGEQLAAYAVMIDGFVMDGEERACIEALLQPRPERDGIPFSCVCWSSALSSALTECVDVCPGVDVSVCALSGRGHTHYTTGGKGAAPNTFTLSVCDPGGRPVPCITPGDVAVDVECASGLCVTAGGEGEVIVSYGMKPTHVAPLTLSLSVLGCPLPRSPWPIHVSKRGMCGVCPRAVSVEVCVTL